MNEQPQENRELLDTLNALQARQTLDVVERTRRNVMEAAQRMQESRSDSRQRLGIALLAMLVFLLLATPAIWSFTEAAFSESTITDASILTLTVFVVLLSTAMGAVLSRGRRRGLRQ
jgi:cation transport ATPase